MTMTNSAPCFSLLPLSVHTPYLFLDKKTRTMKGFALLTKARQEGDRFKLKKMEGRLTVVKIEKISQWLREGTDQHSGDETKTTDKDVTANCKDDDKLASEVIDNRVDTEAASADSDYQDCSNSDMMHAHMTAEELVEELLFNSKLTRIDKNYEVQFINSGVEKTMNEKHGSDSPNSQPKSESILKPSDPCNILPCTNAEITPVKKSKKVRKRRLDDAESTPDDPGVGQQPRSCLKLPPGWNNLSPTELVAQMRIVNSVGNDCLENRRISSLVDKLEQHPADVSKVEERKKPKLPTVGLKGIIG